MERFGGVNALDQERHQDTIPPENLKPSCNEGRLSLEKAAVGENELHGSTEYTQGDPEICADEEKLQGVELQCELDKTDLQCDHAECAENENSEIVKCDRVQCENVEKVMNENENIRGDQEWNAQCDPVNVGESDQEVQWDQNENIQCVQTECVIEGEYQMKVQ